MYINSYTRVNEKNKFPSLVLLVIEVCQNSQRWTHNFCGGFSGGLTPKPPRPLGYGLKITAAFVPRRM